MKKLIIPIIVLTVSFLFPSFTVKAGGNSEEFKINSEFKCSKLKLKVDSYILDYKYEDVNGDGVKDDIILIGSRKHSDSTLRDNIKVIVRDGKTEKYYAASPGKKDHGISGSVFTGDFNGDGIADIMVTIGTCDNGASSWYSIFSFKKNKCRYLFEEEKFSRGFDFNIEYADNFEVEILNKTLERSYILNAENKKDTYTSLGIYNTEGRLLREEKGGYDRINSLVPIDVDSDGIYELKSVQTVWGVSRSDILGYGKAVWKYNSNRMELQDFKMLEFAAPGNRQKRQKVIPVWAE